MRNLAPSMKFIRQDSSIIGTRKRVTFNNKKHKVSEEKKVIQIEMKRSCEEFREYQKFINYDGVKMELAQTRNCDLSTKIKKINSLGSISSYTNELCRVNLSSNQCQSFSKINHKRSDILKGSTVNCRSSINITSNPNYDYTESNLRDLNFIENLDRVNDENYVKLKLDDSNFKTSTIRNTCIYKKEITYNLFSFLSFNFRSYLFFKRISQFNSKKK